MFIFIIEVSVLKIVITGGQGFFATRFYEQYKDKYNITLLGRKELDITNREEVLKKIDNIRPDIVIHTAAIADTGLCEDNPEESYRVNVTGTVNVAEACKESLCKMVFLSTEQIFNGNEESGPYTEETIPNPNTVYGKHKLQAEKEISKIIDRLWIIRLTWLFGFPEYKKKVNANIVWNVTSVLLKNEKRYFPTNEYRGMTYVYELLDNFPRILELPYGIYHTGSENNLSTYDIALEVCRNMKLEEVAKQYILKDEEKYKHKARDIRISNGKLSKQGIIFSDTLQSIKKSIEDFNYNFKL